jgi:YfiH family protein
MWEQTDGLNLLVPDWPAPAGVRACVSTREGGVSRAPYASLNLAAHVGDEPGAVLENRRRLHEALALPAEPAWLDQVHGVRVLDLDADASDRRADAALTRREGVICAVLTADCLPVLFCDRQGSLVAVAHAGWRGLQAGVLEATVAATALPAGRLMAWLGPGIGPRSFQVGPEVRKGFIALDPAADSCFRRGPGDRYLADLYALARRRLAAVGVTEVYGGGLCSFEDPVRFYSYRRDGRTGRMAALVYLASGYP